MVAGILIRSLSYTICVPIVIIITIITFIFIITFINFITIIPLIIIRILVRAVGYTIHGLIPCSCVFADRYNREEVNEESNISKLLYRGVVLSA